MLDLVLPAGFTLLLWWASTGLLIFLCLRPLAARGRVFALASLQLPAALAAIAASARVQSTGAAYLAFFAAIAVWAWLEMGFLMGIITGPRRLPCPPQARGWQRFRLALLALLYHELSIVLAACAILALTWRAPNQTASGAFLILMGMRISAKLNIFLGVPHLSEEFLPARLDYLKSYFRRSPGNPLLGVSLAGAMAMAGWLAWQMIRGTAAMPAACGLLLTLVLLGAAEHVFMMTRLPDAALWRWAVPNARQPRRPPARRRRTTSPETMKLAAHSGFARHGAVAAPKAGME